MLVTVTFINYNRLVAEVKKKARLDGGEDKGGETIAGASLRTKRAQRPPGIKERSHADFARR